MTLAAPPAGETTPPELTLDDLVERHGDAVLRLACAMLRDRTLAEDVFQDVFVSAFRSAATIRDPAAVRSWLLTVTANRCRDELRSWSRRHVSYVSDVPEPDLRQDLGADGPDPGLAPAVLDLPPRFREVILLHYYFELPVADVARVVGVPPVTVRTRLHRARAALRGALAKEGSTDV